MARESRTFFVIYFNLHASSSYPDFPTRKVIIFSQITARFTNFNFYLTLVKVEKKLGKSLVVSIIFITLHNVESNKSY